MAITVPRTHPLRSQRAGHAALSWTPNKYKDSPIIVPRTVVMSRSNTKRHEITEDGRQYIRTYIGPGGIIIPPENVAIDDQTGWLYDRGRGVRIIEKKTGWSVGGHSEPAHSTASTSPFNDTAPRIASRSSAYSAIGWDAPTPDPSPNTSLAFAMRSDRIDNDKDYFRFATQYLSYSEMPESRMRRIFGFSPEEIIAGGAIGCVPCRESSLCQPLHLTVFQRANFTDITDGIYQMILPGLRLAERLILHPDTFPFWATVAFHQ